MTDEAKRDVEILHERGCRGCVVKEVTTCAHREKGGYCNNFYHEAADLIESLAAELEQVKQERDGLNILLGQAQSMLETRTRERDAAVQDRNMSCPCEVCARSCQYDKVNPYDECADFMWRGVKEE